MQNFRKGGAPANRAMGASTTIAIQKRREELGRLCAHSATEAGATENVASPRRGSNMSAAKAQGQVVLGTKAPGMATLQHVVQRRDGGGGGGGGICSRPRNNINTDNGRLRGGRGRRGHT